VSARHPELIVLCVPEFDHQMACVVRRPRLFELKNPTTLSVGIPTLTRKGIGRRNLKDSGRVNRDGLRVFA